MLNGWKAIATYLQRDERTAMRWAAERNMPVHRVPGPGRGSVYALENELDAWFAADRARFETAGRSIPVVIELTEPPAIITSPVPWWRRRWIASALIGAGVLFVSVGAITLHHSRAETASDPVFADPATKAIFLQASYDWNLRTVDSLKRAVQEYSETIGRDPRVPAAYVGLANSYLLLREYGSLPEAEAYERAEAAARAAMALSPSSAEAHRALAFIAFWWRQDRATARYEFKRALALKPDDPLTHHWLATALLANGEPAAALREINRARDLDPAATSIITDRAAILYFTGRRDESLAALRALAHEQSQDVSAHRTLAEIALFEGRPDEFLRESATTARLRSDTAGWAEVERWRSAGPNMQAIEKVMLDDAVKANTGWFRIARLTGLPGRRQEAVDALARACGAHEPATIGAPIDLGLSRVMTLDDIAERCGRVTPLS